MANAAPTAQPVPTNPSQIPSGQPPAQAANASLYVGDLDEEITEAMIYEKFSPIGNILSIRVCRDMISRKSLGYAYVNFAQADAADKAIDTLNFDVLKGRQMRIMWSQRDPSLRKSGVGNLFIKNLDKSVTTRELHDTFSLFGEILSCKIAQDDKGQSKGYAFIHFQTQESADNAIEKLNDKLLKEKRLYVGFFVPRSQRGGGPGGAEPQFNNLFVKNFGEDMDEDRLRTRFSQYGDITSVKVEMTDQGKSKGFGFVCFKDHESAGKAVSAENGAEIGGKSIFVGRAMKKSERAEFLRNQFERKKADKNTKYAIGVNLYVKNLDDTIDDDSLRNEFVDFGNITSVKVMRDPSGRSKGFGFVCFSFPDEATRAVTEMNGKLIAGKPLYVALAQRKEERRVHLANQYMQRQFAIRNQMPPGPRPPMGQMVANPMSMLMNQFNPGYMGMPQVFPTGAAGMQNFRQPRWSGQSAPLRQGPMPGMQYNAQQMMRMNPGNRMGGPPHMMQRPQGGAQQSRAPMQGAGMQPQQNLAAGNVMNQPGGMQTRQRQPNSVQINATARNVQPAVRPPMNPNMVQPNMMGNGGLSDEPRDLPLESFVTHCQSVPADEQKQLLGERLYSIISNWHPDSVGKLTGMLLELDNRELLSMIMETSNSGNSKDTQLFSRVEAAQSVLLEQNMRQPPQAVNEENQAEE